MVFTANAQNPIHRAIHKTLSIIITIAKVTVVMLAELGIFPLFTGVLLDMCTVQMFGSTHESRSKFMLRSPFVFTFIHWAVGLAYMV